MTRCDPTAHLKKYYLLKNTAFQMNCGSGKIWLDTVGGRFSQFCLINEVFWYYK